MALARGRVRRADPAGVPAGVSDPSDAFAALREAGEPAARRDPPRRGLRGDRRAPRRRSRGAGGARPSGRDRRGGARDHRRGARHPPVRDGRPVRRRRDVRRPGELLPAPRARAAPGSADLAVDHHRRGRSPHRARPRRGGDARPLPRGRPVRGRALPRPVRGRPHARRGRVPGAVPPPVRPGRARSPTPTSSPRRPSTCSPGCSPTCAPATPGEATSACSPRCCACGRCSRSGRRRRTGSWPAALQAVGSFGEAAAACERAAAHAEGADRSRLEARAQRLRAKLN